MNFFIFPKIVTHETLNLIDKRKLKPAKIFVNHNVLTGKVSSKGTCWNGGVHTQILQS